MMMSYQKKHTRLPSFNELTSTFSNSLQIKSVVDEPGQVPHQQPVQPVAQVQPQQQQQQQQQQHHHQVPHIPQHAHSAPILIPYHYGSVPINISEPPQDFRFPPNQIHPGSQSQGSSTPQGTTIPDVNYVIQPSSTTSTPRSIHQRHRSFDSRRKRRDSIPLNPTQQLQSSQSHVFMGQSVPQQIPQTPGPIPQVPPQVPPQGLHHGSQGLIQPVPPPRVHEKKDSYDSNNSLSTLADIASVDKDLESLLKQLESVLIEFDQFSQILKDIKMDFQNNQQLQSGSNPQHSTESGTGGGVDDGELFKLLNTNGYISINSLKRVLNNIPIMALNDGLTMSMNLNGLFKKWLNLRETLELKEVGIATTTGVTNTIGPKGVINTVNIDADDEAETEDQEDITTSLRKKRLSKKMASIKQQRLNKKHSSSSSISLIVKPSKLTTNPSNDDNGGNIPDSKGVFHEDLSITHHECLQCGSEETPEWRRGPYGSRSLCNACGLFYGKLIKKFGSKEASEIMIDRKKKGSGDDRRIS